MASPPQELTCSPFCVSVRRRKEGEWAWAWLATGGCRWAERPASPQLFSFSILFLFFFFVEKEKRRERIGILGLFNSEIFLSSYKHQSPKF